jgi:small subunit ribosomal protein S10
MAGTKIRIKLRSYSSKQIDESAMKIVDVVKKAGANVIGPVPLPTRRQLFTVIRSPHKDKDSREHFEQKTHKRLLEIVNTNPATIDSLMRIDLPPAVNIQIKL